MNRKLEELEQVIGYSFQDKQMLTRAMTHSSYANEHRMDKLMCNEHLEFLGDAVLEIVSSDFLYHKYGQSPEGELTKVRASIVCKSTLAFCAGETHLGEYPLLGKGKDATGGRGRSFIVPDAIKVSIGAIYLDSGFTNIKEFIHRLILNDIEHKQLFFDSKTILQEMVQSMGEASLSYELIKEDGPDHNKTFEICAVVGEDKIGRGTGRTKEAAEQVAAYHGILTLKRTTDGSHQGNTEEKTDGVRV